MNKIDKEINRYKVPFEVVCGICGGFIRKTDDKEGELSYDGCEHDDWNEECR